MGNLGIGIGIGVGLNRANFSWSAYWLTRTPTTLALSRLSSTTIRLNWVNAGADYHGTSIERSTDGVSYAEVDTVASGVVQYDAVSVNNTTGRFYYRVRCYKGTNYSPYSNVASLVAEAEIVTYITGLATPLYESNIWNLNKLVTDIKSGLSITNLSDAFDVMYILAGETEESSLKNLVKNAHHATAVNAPTFTQYEGFNGNGTSNYIDINWNGRTVGHAINYVLDSASFGIYFRTSLNQPATGRSGSYSTTADGGPANRTIIIRPYSGSPTSLYFGINSGLKDLAAQMQISGMHITVRTANNAQRIDINKTTVLSGTELSTKIPNQNVLGLAAHREDSSITFHDPNQISVLLLGKGFSKSESDIITDAVEVYMDANSKGVIP
jgi:hypothetical protein